MKHNFDIEKSYDEIREKYETYLRDYGVRMLSLCTGNRYTMSALVLVYFYNHIGEVVSKEELTTYLRDMGYPTNDVQSARHLAQQSGWYIISGQRGDVECKERNVGPGEYMLLTVEKPYPLYTKLKRDGDLKANDWEELKARYGFRCATCGSKEGESNYHYRSTITKLNKGHKDPSKPLTLDNTIPQCEFCNKASRNYFIFDNKGRVDRIYDPNFIMRSDEEIRKLMLKILIEDNLNEAKKILSELGNNEIED